ncbi:MAG: adenylate/guanylate cyclase domain-containing protein [Acidimicrobiales bacterium]
MAALPGGVVTFLFTDIEGSTRLFKELGTRYRELLTAHRDILRGAFAAHDGVEVGTEGDGFFVAFASAADAVAACLDGQLALQIHPWPEDGRVAVRMGLHTGEAHPVDGDYISIAVHQAARVAGSGHGGQVVISPVTASLATENLPAGADLLELGAFGLKDFEEPQRLFQLTHSDLPSDFPPLKADSGQGHNLPRPRTALFGRSAELHELEEMVREAQLVTLVGPGGVGKTRLAVELGRRLIGAFEDGVWLTELAVSSGEPAAVAALASALNCPARPGLAPLASLCQGLRDRRLLVVLDNCEHLTDSVANIVDQLLEDAPGVTVLATSREPLGIDGERVWAVPALSAAGPDEKDGSGASPAVQLFADRARTAGGAIEGSDANIEMIGRICSELDGLPLAIELAAARTKILSLEQILERIGSRLALLGRTRGRAPDRQSTLRGAIAWSFDLLDEDEQAVFRRLAVFAGSFTLGAAEAAVDASMAASTIDIIESLVEKSLVTANRGRFSLLETIREFATEQLVACGEEHTARGQQSEYMAERATTVGWRARHSDFDVLVEMDADADNYCLAFDWAERHARWDLCDALIRGLWYWWVRRGEAQRWYRRARAVVDAPFSPTAFCIEVTGELARFAAELHDAVVLKERAIKAFERDGGTTPATVYTDLAEIYVELGDLDRADAAAMRGLELRRNEGQSFGLAHAQTPLVMVALARHDFERAVRLSEKTMQAFEVFNMLLDLAEAQLLSAAAHRGLGNRDRAIELVVSALGHASRLDDHSLRIEGLEQAAALHSLMGDHELALRALAAARKGRDESSFTFRTDESALEMTRAHLDPATVDALLDTAAAAPLREAVERSLAALSDE